tara:strand:- start:2061 stop:2960 length:900 start_codon:yes stop_codon:yes gene_type:complete
MKVEEIEKLILFIDSAKSTRRSHDDFDVDIKNKTLQCNNDDEYIELELTEATARRDFYAVQNFNKHFSIFFSGSDNAFSLQEGNPTSVSIDTELKNDFETAFSTASGHSHNESFTVSFSQYTGRITISSTFQGSVPADLALDTDVENSCFEIIGFSKKKHNFTIDGQNITLTGDLPINVLGEQALFLHCSLVNRNYENNTEGIQNTDLVAKFPILTAPYSNLTFFNTGRLFTSRISTPKLVGFRIRLTNENNVLIGLQSNFTAILTFRKYRITKDKTELAIKDLIRIERLKMLKKNISN